MLDLIDQLQAAHVHLILGLLGCLPGAGRGLGGLRSLLRCASPPFSLHGRLAEAGLVRVGPEPDAEVVAVECLHVEELHVGVVFGGGVTTEVNHRHGKGGL